MSEKTNTDKTIYIFRHGETDWNKIGRIQGHTDIPLNENGRAQAERLREFFRANPVEVFLSSDLQRAKLTAEIASEGKSEIVIDQRLRETQLGQGEGLTHEELTARFGDGPWLDWIDLKKWDARLPGGESKREHLDRILAGIEDYLNKTPHTRIGIASHGGAMRRLLHHLIPNLEEALSIDNCVVYKLTYSLENRTWFVYPDPVHK